VGRKTIGVKDVVRITHFGTNAFAQALRATSNNIAETSRLPQTDAMSHAMFRLLKIAKVRRAHFNLPSTAAQAGMDEQAPS
jgi:hypothetical protein